MVRISKIYRIIISSFLALLGFSCINGGGGTKNEYEQGGEYGTPSATYKAKGVVVSDADGSFIKGIKTELRSDRRDDDWPPIGCDFTNSDGSFSLEGDDFPRQKLYVKLIDVDGEENGGLFAEMEVEADYTNEQFTGGSGHWYEGKAEKDLGTIRIKPENKE